MIQSTRTSQLGIAANLKQDFLTEVGHLDGMLESTRCSGSQLAQQRRVGVAQFHQRQRSSHAKDTLKHKDERLRQKSEQRIQQQQKHHRPIDLGCGQESESKIHQQIAHKHEQRRLDKAVVRTGVRHAEHRDHRGHQLHEDELEGIGHHKRYQHHGEDLSGKCQAQVEKGAHHNGQKANRHHVDQSRCELNQYVGRNNDHQHERQQQYDVLQLREHLLM